MKENKDGIDTQSNNGVNTDTTALAQRNEDVIANHSPIGADGFDLSALPATEQLEIVREIYDAEAQLEAMSLPQVKSRDILGRSINILDAAFKTINVTEDESVDGKKTKVARDKVCVSFVCEYADGENVGEQFTVLKSSNAFNDIFANRFTKLRGIMQRPLNGYEFVEDARYSQAGNNAIVLRRKSQATAAR